MRVCGAELTGNEAVICLLQLDDQQFNILDCRVRKLTLKKEHTREDLLQFQSAFAKLMDDYKVNQIAIKGRMPKGKFAGSSISFKLEAAIQLMADIDVVVLSSTQIKSVLSENPIPISFADTGLKKFQEAAFVAAYAAHRL